MSKASNYSFKLEIILEVKLVLVENLQTHISKSLLSTI
jgi:hypothetical protein